MLVASAILGKLFSDNLPSASTWSTGVFIGLWLFVAAGNMWVGVAKAGYSAAEELPIFLLIFGVPAVAAIVVKWKVL